MPGRPRNGRFDELNILDETRQINENTKRTADNTDGLIDKLDTGFKDLKSELTEIKKNTKDTSGR